MPYAYADFLLMSAVMILSFRTDRPGQTVQTQIRLLLEEQSDQGLHCLPFCLHLLDSLLYGRATCSNFRIITAIFQMSEFLEILQYFSPIKLLLFLAPLWQGLQRTGALPDFISHKSEP